jgi:excisionase family DNA binding protein
MDKLKLVHVTPEQLEQLIRDAVKESFEAHQKVPKNDESITYLDKSEAAKILKISISTVNNWSRQGKLNPHGLGGRVYFKLSEIDQAMVPLNQVSSLNSERYGTK